MVETGAAVCFRHQDPEQPKVGGLLHQVSGELAALVDGFGARLDLPLGELRNQLANLLLFRAEGELHYRTWTMVASPCAMPEQMPAAP